MRLRSRATFTVVATGVLAVLVALGVASAQADAATHSITFTMVRSAVAEGANCLAKAKATVKVENHGVNEIMTLRAEGLPAKTGFDLFITQLPNAPFGVSWYQSDLQSDSKGKATVVVRGRFNVETFTVAPGARPAPQTHPGVDATENPSFAPVHNYHVAFWFNRPADAVKAGCPGGVTPFNGEHNAGVQAMSTRNFPDLAGPLSKLS